MDATEIEVFGLPRCNRDIASHAWQRNARLAPNSRQTSDWQ